MNDDDDMLELLDEDEQFLGLETPPTEEPPHQTQQMVAEEKDSGTQKEKAKPTSEPRVIEIPILYIGIFAVVIIALLVSIFVLLPALTSSQIPQATITPSTAGTDVFLYHNGGTPIDQGNLRIKINGALLSPDKYMLLGGQTWPYEKGKTLRVITGDVSKPAVLTLVDSVKDAEYPLLTYQIEGTLVPTPVQTIPQPDNQSIPSVPMTPPAQGAAALQGNQTTLPAQPPQMPGEQGTPQVIPTGVNPQAQGGQPVATPTAMPTPNATAVPPAGSPLISSVPPSTAGPVKMEENITSGMQPLIVQFTDNTNGCVVNRTWDFGDGLTSDKRYPVYTYPFPGVYNASLSVLFCDAEDNKYAPPTVNITVAPVVRQDGLAKGSGSSVAQPGGKVYFTVQGPAATVRIGGMNQDLLPGDHVELDLNSGGLGEITIVKGALLVCNFPDVTMIVNGKNIAKGAVSEININKYDKIAVSGLTTRVKAGASGAKGLINGVQPINAGKDQILQLSDIGPDSTGNLIISNMNGAGFNFRGGVTSYEILSSPIS